MTDALLKDISEKLGALVGHSKESLDLQHRAISMTEEVHSTFHIGVPLVGDVSGAASVQPARESIPLSDLPFRKETNLHFRLKDVAGSVHIHFFGEMTPEMRQLIATLKDFDFVLSRKISDEVRRHPDFPGVLEEVVSCGYHA